MRKPGVPPVPDAAGWGIMVFFIALEVVFMRKLVNLAILTAMLAGCAGPTGRAPTAIYPDGAGQVREHATGPYGQETWMVRLGADGKQLSAEQVLNDARFATVRVGATGKQDMLRTFGRPAETSRVAQQDFEVWSYRYKQGGVWPALMHVHFDRDGIVRMMMNGPDPMYDKSGQRD